MRGQSLADKLGGERVEGVEEKTETAAASTVVGELAAEAAGIRHDLQWILGCAGSSLFHDGLLVVQAQLEARLAGVVAQLELEEGR